MTTYLKYSKFSLTCLLLLLATFSACKYDDLSVVKPNENFRLAGDFLRNNYDYSLFYAGLQYTGLAEKLNEPGPFTVIAPGNKAFNELGIQLPSDFQKLNRDSLRQVLSYHIINRKLLVENMPVNGVDVRYETLADISLYASIASRSPFGNISNTPYFSGSKVIRKDIPLVNGTLQAVDKIMKQYPGKKVQDWLTAHNNYSIFVAGLKKFGLWDELAGKGPFTIFAPDNTVFTNAGITQAFIDQMNPAEYKGERLFGVYIMYDKSYFMSDRDVFAFINNETEYIVTPRGDDTKLRWTTQSLEAISPLSRGFFHPVTWAGSDFAQTDHLLENGLIHRSPAVLMLPVDAKK